MDQGTRTLLERTFERARGLSTLFGILLFGMALGVEVLKFVFSPFEGLLSIGAGQLQLIRFVIIGTVVLDSAALPVIRRVMVTPRDENQDAAPVIGRIFSASVTTLAITSSAAVLGLLLFLLGGRSLDFYGLWFVSLVFLVLYFPRVDRWEERLMGGPGGF